MGKVIKGISPEAMEVLMDHDWPGNVRELRSLVERAFILTQDNIIKPKDLPFSMLNSPEKAISTLAEHEKTDHPQDVRGLHLEQKQSRTSARY